MPDLLVRDLSAGDIARLDERARELGISRSEYVRRKLRQDAGADRGRVSRTDLERFSRACADLADEDVMRGAWGG